MMMMMMTTTTAKVAGSVPDSATNFHTADIALRNAATDIAFVLCSV